MRFMWPDSRSRSRSPSKFTPSIAHRLPTGQPVIFRVITLLSTCHWPINPHRLRRYFTDHARAIYFVFDRIIIHWFVRVSRHTTHNICIKLHRKSRLCNKLHQKWTARKKKVKSILCNRIFRKLVSSSTTFLFQRTFYPIKMHWLSDSIVKLVQTTTVIP